MPPKTPEAIAHQKAYQREHYRWYRDHGICWKCKTAEAMPMRIYCKACRDAKIKEYHEHPEIHERQARSHKARREKLIAAGICVWCGKRPAMPGVQFCGPCHKKRMETQQVCAVKTRIKKEMTTLKASKNSRPNLKCVTGKRNRRKTANVNITNSYAWGVFADNCHNDGNGLRREDSGT